jgi:hypothetical protein
MKDAQTSLEKLTKNLASIAKVITAITSAVKIGGELPRWRDRSSRVFLISCGLRPIPLCRLGDVPGEAAVRELDAAVNSESLISLELLVRLK